MAESLFTSLLGMLDPRTVDGIAGSLGASGQSVSQGLKSSIATVLGSLASKAEDPHALRTVLDTAPADTTLPDVARAASDPNSPLIQMGRRVLSTLFGDSAPAVGDAIGSASGLGTGTASRLLSLAAPMVLSFIGNRVRTDGLSMTGLGNLLQREIPAIRNALPPGLSDMFWPRSAAAATYPVATPTTPRRGSNWPAVIAIAALLLGLVWLLNHFRRPAAPGFGRMGTGAASRMTDYGNFVRQQLPDGVDINVPERGTESRLLSLVKDNTVSDRAWVEFDRLSFIQGSATLRPESQEQLNNIAAILMAYPNVKLKVGGFTDNMGSADQNLRLSTDRANAVMAELVRRGISPDRLTAEGYGDQNPVADNSSEEGRARNRRVAMMVTQK